MTAAVVGVIANLALFFIAAVAYPVAIAAGVDASFKTQPDWIALALVLAAAFALWRLQWGVVRVIAAAALAGLLLHFGGWR